MGGVVALLQSVLLMYISPLLTWVVFGLAFAFFAGLAFYGAYQYWHMKHKQEAAPGMPVMQPEVKPVKLATRSSPVAHWGLSPKPSHQPGKQANKTKMLS